MTQLLLYSLKAGTDYLYCVNLQAPGNPQGYKTEQRQKRLLWASLETDARHFS
jgi:hypothetical protein